MERNEGLVERIPREELTSHTKAQSAEQFADAVREKCG